MKAQSYCEGSQQTVSWYPVLGILLGYAREHRAFGPFCLQQTHMNYKQIGIIIITILYALFLNGRNVEPHIPPAMEDIQEPADEEPSVIKPQINKTVYAEPNYPEIPDSSNKSLHSYVTRRSNELGYNPEYIHSIIFCESSWRTNATNTNTTGSVDHGLFQVNDYYWPPHKFDLDYRNNAYDNIEMGLLIMKRQPSAWSASSHCHDKETTRAWVRSNILLQN